MPNIQIPKKNIPVLIEYLRHLSGEKVEDFVLEVGPKRFAVCAGCHGADAKGIQALGAPNLTDDIWLHGRSRIDIQNILVNGVTANMPRFSDLLSETEIKLLTAYIISINDSYTKDMANANTVNEVSQK